MCRGGPGVCGGQSRYLRQPRKAGAVLVPGGAVVRSCPPSAVRVTFQVTWATFVFFTGAERSDNVTPHSAQDLGCYVFLSDPQLKAGSH